MREKKTTVLDRGFISQNDGSTSPQAHSESQRSGREEQFWKKLTDDRTNRDTARSVRIRLRRPVGEVHTVKGFHAPRSRSSSSERCFPDSSASFSSARCRPRSSAMRIAWPLGSHPFVLQAARSSIPAKATSSTESHEYEIAHP